VAFGASVNFQPAAAPPYPGYLVDGGDLYGPRGNGLTYGWNVSTAAAAFDRNSRRSPDQRYDTLIAMQQIPNAFWEIAVPNGTYRVRIVAGDPNTTKKLAYRITAEGVLTVNGAGRWVEGTQTVTVADGRLTVASGAGASGNKICFIEISASS